MDNVFIPPGPQDDVFVDWTHDFVPTDPKKIGYVPWPLLYQCSVCRVLKEFGSVREQVEHPLPTKCRDHRSRWRQVDVVFAHWSGDIQPLSPWRFHYNEKSGEVSQLRSCQCGGTEFRLLNKSPSFSEWAFQCLTCSGLRQVVQKDKHSLTILKPLMDAGNDHEWAEINMLPVSYRANSVHYVQSGRFVILRDPRPSELMTADRREELLHEVARLHGVPRRPPPEQQLEAAVRDSGLGEKWDEWKEYNQLAQDAATSGRLPQSQKYQRLADEIMREWLAAEIVSLGEVDSAELSRQAEAQVDWARRFNPFQRTLEHAALRHEHVDEKAGITAFDVLFPDKNLSEASDSPARLADYKVETGDLLRKLGLSKLVLIKGLPICEYTFGYTRVSATPIHTREVNDRKIPVPVRLNAFPPLKNGKRPVYVLQQANEAFYVRLDEERVRAWLIANGVPNVPASGTHSIGAAYLEQYRDFGPFLEEYRKRIGQPGAVRELPAYVYMLLHTLAHQMVHAMAETSGLDSDGIGELVYPADLAFVVYRKGMTPDLGHLSAMWRNRHREFLRMMGDPRRLRCGSGSLCDARGGACPACVMLPDVTCTASNQLLSRAVLAGGRAPMWEEQTAPWVEGWLSPTFIL
ncbi:hypothetical protein K8640_42035 [Myxococcus sp. XM-1-1-1]|uniref:hypothetical protein n=1 Tax=Myxococcus sp. XM-1-1-1 TaxID=2874602 RepID=UPI001CBFC26B|nr:hypothetical protein [Myxococcus sp. XM-1-1-1]MBZ4414810.1 hypothetical protein [Myxococcus sp. XM-1-1-1]